MEQSKYHYIEQIKKMVIDRSEQELVPVMPSDEAIAAPRSIRQNRFWKKSPVAF